MLRRREAAIRCVPNVPHLCVGPAIEAAAGRLPRWHDADRTMRFHVHVGAARPLPAQGGSKSNREEARVVAAVVANLLAAGLGPGDIGVVTPYAAQVGQGAAGRMGLWGGGL
jgi:hypothetical protein